MSRNEPRAIPTALDFFMWNFATDILCLTAFIILADQQTFINLLNQ